MIILIPAYEPEERLVDLVRSVRRSASDQLVVVVDDGSGPAYSSVFDDAAEAGAVVLRHYPNRGKGYALKQGFGYIQDNYPGHDVVCADCDGQHALCDILRVADELSRSGRAVVLGARQFVGDVPARSRFGNTLTRRVFRATTGVGLQDTQTGLRGYASALLPWLRTIGGDRFEYELEVLLAAQKAGFEFHEVPIATIYLNGNESSHFRTVHDSIRVYVPFVKFGLSSIMAFAIDAGLLFVMMASTGNLAASVVTARIASATVNYRFNHRLVFGRGHGTPARSAVRYGSLVVALMGANFMLLHVLTERLSVALLTAKLLTEATLFGVSFHAQRRYVFGPTVERTVADRTLPSRREAPREFAA